jgi:hypothetical protein
MSKFDEAIKKAEAAGHDLKSDPPANLLASVDRYTCKNCGRAVLGNNRNAYGSATEAPCAKPKPKT